MAEFLGGAILGSPGSRSKSSVIFSIDSFRSLNTLVAWMGMKLSQLNELLKGERLH